MFSWTVFRLQPWCITAKMVRFPLALFLSGLRPCQSLHYHLSKVNKPFVSVHEGNTYRYIYRRIRLWSVLFIRLAIPLGFIGFGIYDKPPSSTVFAVIMMICTKSPVSNMLFSATNLRVLFPQQVIIHTIAIGISLLWIPGFCTNCSANPDLENVFNQVFYAFRYRKKLRF